MSLEYRSRASSTIRKISVVTNVLTSYYKYMDKSYFPISYSRSRSFTRTARHLTNGDTFHPVNPCFR